ncbi:MAG: hypothetical protein E3K32_09510 [wastewater metagenome]|nr:hypothetical protein [Candidatus Loosdrechtia aerotolerans]
MRKKGEAMMQRFLCVLAVVLTCSFIGCTTKNTVTEETKPAVKEAAQLEFPKDYKNWTHATSKIILDKTSPLYGFQQVFVNDTGLEAYKNGGGYPDGSIILLGFYEPILEGDDIAQGDIIWYAVMKKDSTAERTGGWIFDGFDGKTFTSTVSDPIGGCYNCHMAKKNREYVFTEFAGEVNPPDEASLESEPNDFAFPVDFRSWQHSNFKVILDKESPLYGFQQIYVNDIGFQANKTSGTYPDGSQVIVGFYEPVKEDGVISQGDIIWYAAMKKDSTAAEAGGWIFDGFDSESLQSKIDDPVAGCYMCHTSMKDNDYIFSKYVP